MLAPEFPPVWGGVGTYTVELIRNLPNNIEVHVVTPMRLGFNGENFHSEEFLQFLDKNIKIHYVSKATDTFLYNASFQYACLRTVPKLIKEEKIDLIHSHAAHMPDLLLKTLEKSAPTVTTVHTTITGQRAGTKASHAAFKDLEFSEKMTLLTYPLLYFIDNLYFSKSALYITPSNWMKTTLLKGHPSLNKNVFVIPHGIDTTHYRPIVEEHSKDKNVILFVGRLIALKGIFNLIHALPIILKEHPNTIVLFVGPGEKEPYIKELNRCGVPASSYQFLGHSDKKNLLYYYNISDVYVLPSFSESFSLTLLEAMSCGVPAVVSNVGGPSEIIKNHFNGVLVEPGDVKALAEAIIFLLDNHKIRRRIGREARRTIEAQYSWRMAAIRTALIYNYTFKTTSA
jgi:glycosyltransferase involved in cell wall biosynthesis